MFRLSSASTSSCKGPGKPFFPDNLKRKGLRKTSATTMADAVCPGRPNTALEPALAIMVGLPGLMDMPWTSNSTSGKDSKTLSVMSLVPTELPPDIQTVSASPSPFSNLALSSSKLSLHSPKATASAPACQQKALRV